MMDFLILALIASLKIAFIHVVFTWEGMLFAREGRKLEYRLPWFFHKALFSCHICMSSFWGITFYFIDKYVNAEIKQCIDFIFIVGGINVIISCFIGRKHFEEEFNGG